MRFPAVNPHIKQSVHEFNEAVSKDTVMATGAKSLQSSGKSAPLLPRHVKHVFPQAHTGPISIARFNSNGSYILSAGADRVVKLWNAQNGPTFSSIVPSQEVAQRKSIPIQSYSAHSHEILALDITEDHSRFVSGGADQSVLMWDVTSGQVIRRFSGHVGKVQVVHFGGGGGGKDSATTSSVLMTAGFDSTLRFYDLRAAGAWKPIMECKEAKDAVMCLATTKRQSHLVTTGSVDGCVRTYDLRMGELRTDVIDGRSFSRLYDPTHSVTDVAPWNLSCCWQFRLARSLFQQTAHRP